ncbi:energy-coupling factor ABC transporter substrate-binding protein [Methanosphaera sp.]
MVNYKQLGLLVIVAILIIAPLVIYNGYGEDEGYFGGSDDAGGEAIEESNPDYEVWAEPFWEPPSGEIQSLLFCVQTAIGAIIVGYIFGYWHGGRKAKKE